MSILKDILGNCISKKLTERYDSSVIVNVKEFTITETTSTKKYLFKVEFVYRFCPTDCYIPFREDKASGYIEDGEIVIQQITDGVLY